MKNKPTELETLKEKWKQQEQKEKLRDVKKQKIVDAIDKMIFDNAPKNGQTLAKYSGITTWEASMIFEELYGTTVSRWFKQMNIQEPIIEDVDDNEEEY